MQEIQAKYDLDLTEFFAKMNQVSDRYGAVENYLTSMKRVNPFTQQNTAASQLNSTLGQQVQVYQKIQATAESFRQEQARLKQVYTELKQKQNEYIAAGKYSELTAQLDQVKTRLREMKVALGEAADEAEKATKPGKGSLLNPLSIKNIAAELTSAITVSLGFAEALKLTVTESAKFGRGLSQLSALTGVTGKDLDYLADAATNLENRTGIAADQIVEGFKLVGGIKPELLESKEALAQVTDEVIALSQASGESLADSAKAAIGALNQFGEGADQASRFVNVLAAGAKVGASEVNDTAEALKSSGTAMKAAGLSFEEGNALIQSLAGVMIKGSEAGTALRNVLLKLETDSDKNLRPSIVGLDKALENAAKKYDTTTELTKVFGVENIVAARRVLETREEVAKLTKELTGTNVAYEQQATNLDNLATDLDKAGVAFKGFFRNLGQSQDGFLRYAIQSFTNFLNQLSSKNGEYRAFLRGFFQEGIFQTLPGALVRGRAELERQQQANAAANALRTQNQTVLQTAAQTVGNSVSTRTNELITSGLKKDDAAVQAAQETLLAAQDKLIKVRKQYYDTANAIKQANGQNRKQLLEDGKLDALALKQARENVKVATSALDQARRQKNERATALKTALNEPLSDDAKKAGAKAKKDAQENYKLLLSVQEDYVKEYQKLQEEFGKDRLEALKKDQNTYIKEVARLEKEELDVREAAILKKLQLASAKTTRINPQTGVREPVANTSVVLPADVKAQFDNRRNQIDAEAERQIRINRIRQQYDLIALEKQSNQQELALFDKKWEEILASETAGSEKYLALVRKNGEERNALIFDQIIRDQKAIESIIVSNIQRRTKLDSETGQQFFKRNVLDELAAQQFSSESQISALQGQNNPANNPEIARLEAFVKAIKDKRKEIQLLTPANRDIYDLLGISKSFKDETERQLFLNSMDAIKASVQAISQAIVEQSEQRIAALDAQIQAKEEQIQTEEERDKEGYANNLALRKQELEDLKRQKKEEEDVKRKAMQVQSALDLATLVSTNAVSAANLFAAATEAAKQNTKLGPIIGVISAIAGVATIIGTLFAARAKIKAMSLMRKGGKLDGPTHEHGGIKGTGAFGDIEVEGGEHITNAKSSDRFDKTLDALNKNNPHLALANLMREGGFGLPQLIIDRMKQPGWGKVPTLDLASMNARLDEHSALLKEVAKNTLKGKQYVPLADGRIMIIDGNSKTIQTP